VSGGVSTLFLCLVFLFIVSRYSWKIDIDLFRDFDGDMQVSPSKVAKRKPETTTREVDAFFRAYLYRCPDVSLVPTQLVFSPGRLDTSSPVMEEDFNDDYNDMSTPIRKRSKAD
jgi:hypothetical protein